MDDWGVFFSDFSDLAHWQTQEGEFADLDGIFNPAHQISLSGDTVGVSSIAPVLTVAESQIPATAAQGDDLEIRSVNYRVSDIQPDGAGLARVILERA